MEGVLRARTVRGGVGERADDLELLDDRSGPAVRDDERQRTVMLRANVDEMDVEPVDLGDELRQGVQSRLHLAPVVLCRPIAGECLHRRELHALRCIRDRFPLGPLCRGDAPAELGEGLARSSEAEGADVGMGRDGQRGPAGLGHAGLLLVSLLHAGGTPGCPCWVTITCSWEPRAIWRSGAIPFRHPSVSWERRSSAGRRWTERPVSLSSARAWPWPAPVRWGRTSTRRARASPARAAGERVPWPGGSSTRCIIVARCTACWPPSRSRCSATPSVRRSGSPILARSSASGGRRTCSGTLAPGVASPCSGPCRCTCDPR